MFDVGFWELALIGVIALIVVGPDRLPGMARTVGFWIGRTRRYVDQVRRDVEREIHAEELRDAIQGKGGLDDLYQAVDETRSAVREIESDFDRSTDPATDEDAQAAAEEGAGAGKASAGALGADEAGAEEKAGADEADVDTTGAGQEAAAGAPGAEGAVAAESAESRVEPEPGEPAGAWTEGIRGPAEVPPGAEPTTSSAGEAEPEPRRDERRENHG